MLNNVARLSSVANKVGRHTGTTSDKYTHVSTAHVLDVLAAAGWVPVSGTQVRARKENDGFQKHMIKLQNPAYTNALATPQAVLLNSHNGTGAFKLMVGLNVRACMNGLIMASEVYETTNVRHVGYADQKVELALGKIVNLIPQMMAKMAEWSSIILTEGQAVSFALEASQLRASDSYIVNIHELLRCRHYEQRPLTLWNVFNRVQEGLVKGGVRVKSTVSGKVQRSRTLKNIAEDIKINQAIWTLADKTAKGILTC